MLKKGQEVEQVILVFIGCGILMFAAVWMYSKKDDTAYSQTLTAIKQLETRLKEVEQLSSSNNTTVAAGNLRIQVVERKIECATQLVDKSVEDVNNLQEHCAKLREGQISIREALAMKKRPIIQKSNDPIRIEFVEKAKNTSKQMKELGL